MVTRTTGTEEMGREEGRAAMARGTATMPRTTAVPERLRFMGGRILSPPRHRSVRTKEGSDPGSDCLGTVDFTVTGDSPRGNPLAAGPPLSRGQSPCGFSV